jgi:hypothetical protein
VAENLYQASAAGHDPFHCLLEHDRLASDERLAAAKEAEERWQETKQRESAEAEQSLADLIAVIGRPARTA